MTQQRWSEDGWPIDDEGRRTDPIGRHLESLTPEQRAAWGATCSVDVPVEVIEDGHWRTVYPWESEHPWYAIRRGARP